ncbi:unnamed protein product, partial [Tetraodon nigroviridis]
MDLELALERKKAELRALEEGDVSAGGSSPCSETSQEASGPRGVLLKKNRWKTIFPGVASPDSNSRSSDLVENTETGIGEGENNESPEEKTVSKPAVKEEAETSDVKVETPELKVWTRFNAGRRQFQIGQLANTLISKMEFLGINKKAISNFQLLLLQTETRIADWREGALDGVYLRRRLQEAAEHIKYYELNATPKGWSCHWDREHRRYFYVNDRTGASQWEFPTEEENCEDPKGSQGAETQGADQPDTKAPTSGAAATGTEEEAGTRPALPPGAVVTNVRDSPGFVWVSSSDFCTSVCVLNLFILLLFINCSFWSLGAPWQRVRNGRRPGSRTKLLLAAAPSSTHRPPSAQSKKKIKMPSLVKKWQSIQKELDEEEKSSSSDEDRDQLNKKSIEEWKHQQILTGKASKNANFEALPEDWRDRIKRRKM